MNDITIITGFHPEVKREYHGEHIYRIVDKRYFSVGRDKKPYVFYRVENGVWIKDLGDNKYESDWNREERWGRVEKRTLEADGNISTEVLGFIILRVNRKEKIL